MNTAIVGLPVLVAYLNQLLDAGAHVSFPLPAPRRYPHACFGLVTMVEGEESQNDPAQLTLWYDQADAHGLKKLFNLNDPLTIYLNVGA